MAKTDDSFGKAEDEELPVKPFNKKKVLIFVLPIIIVIGLAVSFITVFTRSKNSDSNAEYNILTSDGAEGGKVTVFYSLPELAAHLRSSTGKALTAKLKLSIELSAVEDIKTVEALLPRINDTLLAHITELTPEEISGSDGLYNLKEELLFRINLLTDPVKVSNLNFKSFDIQ